MTKTVKIVEPALCVAMYEVEKLIKTGYSISQTNEPIFLAGLYDIEMVKPTWEEKIEAEIAEAKQAGIDEQEEKPVAPKPRGRKPKASE